MGKAISCECRCSTPEPPVWVPKLQTRFKQLEQEVRASIAPSENRFRFLFPSPTLRSETMIERPPTPLSEASPTEFLKVEV
jgi:hypothetical protein